MFATLFHSRHIAIPIICFLIFNQTTFAEDLSYNRDIRPILSDKCFFCHGPDEDERQADLRLDIEDAAKESAIVPGNLGKSTVIERIQSADTDLRMPPGDSGKELSKHEIELIKTWVQQGADYEPFWAYVPPGRKPEFDGLPLNKVIDKIVRKRVAEEGLSPARPADPVTLLRRLYFDLTGLPPTEAEVAKFVDNPTPDAYEAVIDKLLDSPHFGERMAIYWLDLVRYADTVGYHGDQDHSISPYRDWVINAFNSGMPFDQFTVEQLAGDLLPNPTQQQQIATGYNRLLQTSHEGGVQPKEYLAIYAADRVRNVSAVWMGATMGCAQCHNHKYDPYTMKDFYSLAAFFADVDEAQHFKLGSNALPTRRPPEIEVLSDAEATELNEIEAQLAKLGEDNKEQKDKLLARQKQIHQQSRKCMVTVSIEPREMRLLPRGNWLDDSGPIVTSAIPEFLGKIETDQERASRLDLAKWLTDPENGVGGLTARVQVNRFWYLLFGTGISRTLDDLGGQGEPPSYPELLDQLAISFLAMNWDIKQLVKQILLSETYQQSSDLSKTMLEKDPNNQLFARQGSFRLSAEMVRDNALAISGLLVTEVGGRSIRPYQPAGYYRHLNFPTRVYKSDEDSSQYRRGVYIHWQRQFLHPMLKAFDAPSREECTAQRPRSNTPLAALVLLNDPTFVEAAIAFAELILSQENMNDQQRIEFAFRRAVSRSPEAAESEILKSILQKNRAEFSKDSNKLNSLLSVGLNKAPKSDQVELAAWTSVARVILNLNETISRN